MVVRGWENLDNSPNVYLSRVPYARKLLRAIRILTREQAEASFPSGIIRVDLRKSIPYPDRSVSFIYSSHLIEHLSRWQALELVRECVRVMRPGGVMRVATPDLAELVRAYTRGDTSGGRTPADSLMQRMMTFSEVPGNFTQRLIRRLITAPHQWLYDFESLVFLLEEGGLVDPQVRPFREGQLPDLDLIEHRRDSLIVEARGPLSATC